MRNYFNLENLFIESIISFLLIFEKLSLKTKNYEKKYEKILIFRLCKFNFENAF